MTEEFVMHCLSFVGAISLIVLAVVYIVWVEIRRENKHDAKETEKMLDRRFKETTESYLKAIHTKLLKMTEEPPKQPTKPVRKR